MNSLVPLSLNFRLCNLPHLSIIQPYFQFRWIGILSDQNPLVSIVSPHLIPFLSGFLRGSKGNRSATIRKTFLEFFSPFFSQLITPFNHLHSPFFQKRMQMYNLSIPNSKFIEQFFQKFFRRLFSTLYFNSLPNYSTTFLSKWSAKVQNGNLQFKAFLIKISLSTSLL